MTCSIVIADDHPLVLKGLFDYLIEKGHTVLASASDGKSAYEKILALKPDVAILDIKMPGMSGLDIANSLINSKLKTKLVLITFEKDGRLLSLAKSLNVQGFILKEFALAEIDNCLKALAKGETFFSKELNHAVHEDDLDLSQLSTTEMKVIKHIAQNKTTRTIADIMFISPRTVEKHRSNIIRKLNLNHHQNSLLIWAKEHQEYLI